MSEQIAERKIEKVTEYGFMFEGCFYTEYQFHEFRALGAFPRRINEYRANCKMTYTREIRRDRDGFECAYLSDFQFEQI